MEYNTTRGKLIIPEYGRNIQKMIEHCVTIKEKDERTRFAYLIVNVMGQMTPKGKESGDMQQKLWDHLHIISGFQLDVDSPFPPPEKDFREIKPNPLSYSDQNFKYRHYGKNIEKIIEKTSQYPDGEEKDALIQAIANHLKKSYLNWNRDSVDDDLILENLQELSKGKLVFGDDMKLSHTSVFLSRNKKKKFTKTSQGNHKGKQRRS
jgi:hypothetical protein